MIPVQVSEEFGFLGVAAVSLRSTLKYRRNWNKNGPTVKLLRKLMPRGSKGYRVYMPIGVSQNMRNVIVPLPVRLAVKQAGFRITDYLAKKCVKISDKEQKNEFNIGKVIAKDPVAKAAFDNDPQLQNSSTAEFQLVVSCHPYDIIGMSTGRSWDNESCMRLRDYRPDSNDGSNNHYLEVDIAEGTLVAYAIRASDTNIEKPLGRCLLKPFVSETGGDDILYRRETKIYGNPVPGMPETLNRFLRKLNADIPAGQYKLHKGLYNDGIQYRHNREESEGERDTDQIDWTVVDDEATLKEKPHLFASLVAHFLKNYKAGLTDIRHFISVLFHASNMVPAKYLRQAARLLCTDDIAKGFMQFVTEGDEDQNTILAGYYLRNPEFRRLCAQHIPEGVDAAYSRVLSFVSPKFDAAILKGIPNNVDAHILSAYQILTGMMQLSPKSIESRPDLHRIIYLFARLARDASIFDMRAYQEPAHQILATSTVNKEEIPLVEVVKVAEFLVGEPDTMLMAATWMLEYMKTGDFKRAEVVAAYISPHGFEDLLKERKLRRRFLGGKGIPESTMKQINIAVCALLDNNQDEDTATTRDLLAHIAKTPFNAVNVSSYNRLVNAHPETFPNVYYTDANTMDRYTINEMVYYVPSYEVSINIRDGEPLPAPVNEWQARTWEIAGTLMHVSALATKSAQEALPVSETVMEILEKEGGDIPQLARMEIDIKKHPRLFNGNTVKYMMPFDFIGNDNGEAFMERSTRGDIDNFVKIMETVFENAGKMGIYMPYTDPNYTRVPSDVMFITVVSNVAKNETPDKAQALLNSCLKYIRTYQAFIDTLPAIGPGFVDRWVEKLSMYSAKEVNDWSIHIAGFQKKMLDDPKTLIAGIKLLTYMCSMKGGNKGWQLDISDVPADWQMNDD
jgi:hypothetical protein